MLVPRAGDPTLSVRFDGPDIGFMIGIGGAFFCQVDDDVLGEEEWWCLVVSTLWCLVWGIWCVKLVCEE